MEQITKSELIDILENDDAAEYMGTFEVNTETRAYYRTALGAGFLDKHYKLVFIEV